MKDEGVRFWLVIITINIAMWLGVDAYDIEMLKVDIEQIKLECQVLNDKAEG